MNTLNCIPQEVRMKFCFRANRLDSCSSWLYPKLPLWQAISYGGSFTNYMLLSLWLHELGLVRENLLSCHTPAFSSPSSNIAKQPTYFWGPGEETSCLSFSPSSQYHKYLWGGRNGNIDFTESFLWGWYSIHSKDAIDQQVRLIIFGSQSRNVYGVTEPMAWCEGMILLQINWNPVDFQSASGLFPIWISMSS